MLISIRFPADFRLWSLTFQRKTDKQSRLMPMSLSRQCSGFLAPFVLSSKPASTRLCSRSPPRHRARTSMSSLTKTATPSWTELAENVPSQYLQPDYKNGPPRVTPSKEFTSVRLFGQRESDIRLVLYRDTAYWVRLNAHPL